MPREKIKFAMRIRPETKRLVEALYPRDNCQSQNEFIEKAIHFYAGYVSSKDTGEYLPPLLLSGMRGIVQDTENRICRLLFKLAVEADMTVNVLAAALEIDKDQLRDLRGSCVRNVKRTSGSISLDDAVERQRDAGRQPDEA